MNRNIDQVLHKDLEEALAQIEAPRAPADLAVRCLSTISAQQNEGELAPAGSQSEISRFAPLRLFGTRGMKHSRLKRRLTWTAASVTVVCTAGVIVSIILLVPGTLIPPTPAFSEVEAAMRSIHTAHWSESKTRFNEQGNFSVTRDESWVRLDLPTLSTTSLPSERPPSDNLVEPGTRNVTDAKNMRLYFPESHTAPGHPSGRYFRAKNPMNNPVGSWRKTLLGMLISPPLRLIASSSHAASGGNHGMGNFSSLWSVQSTMLEGRNVNLFEIKGTDARNRQEESSLRLWTDPVTHLIVRREERIEERQGGKSGRTQTLLLIVDENYRYDETPPAGIFSLTPPPGIAVKDMN